ncbi:MAG: amidase [Acidobacteriota bacterium]
MTSDQPNTVGRRTFFTYLASLGIAAAAADTLWAEAEKQGAVTPGALAQAEKIAGIELTDAQREMMLDGVEELARKYAAIRAVPLDNAVAPALHFDPVLPGTSFGRERRPPVMSPQPRLARPANLEELAFAPVTVLAELVRSRQVRSLELTELSLARLKQLNPSLNCVVTLTEERALAQAERSDREIAAGGHRGPLHGIPWGAKDLLAVKGYPTTWGASPYQHQVIDEDATVVQRLDEAGAVLVAKLTLGSLANGDIWFGGQTCSPWNLNEGSSGSSAGPAAAVVAGLVGFAIGTETRGSILSPCTRCGATGLRPTFGRVSRAGAMALAWSMDKVGPICRSVEDCALVLAAIAGPDGRDETVVDLPFNWDARRDVRTLRVGYLKSIFERQPSNTDDPEWYGLDLAAVEALRSLGVELVPIELPDLPIDALSFILNVEAAAAFDELTRSGRDRLLVRQGKNDWPNRFRVARMVPAVEYLQANRVRRLAMAEMRRILAGLDVYVSPTYGGTNLPLTNLTGHPAVVLPDGFRDNGTPVSITFMGNLFAEAEALLLAKAYQDATGFHLRRPPLFT